jgi:GDPmannose 4,6-dehydratase
MEFIIWPDNSVSLSFGQPMETQESIYLGTLNLLEAVRFTGRGIKLYNASSSECFGDLGGQAATEETTFRPRSPYAVAKSAAFWQVANYREAYNLFACSGILFLNYPLGVTIKIQVTGPLAVVELVDEHESPLRPERFVTQKIVRSACRIAEGKQNKLPLGNIDIQRDWGWAPEYVEAIYLMLQQESPDDFVIATGRLENCRISLRQLSKWWAQLARAHDY